MARIAASGSSFAIAAQKTLEATRALHVKVAKRENARIMGAVPRPQSFTRWVDGRKDAAEDAVKPHGVILYRYPRLDLVAQYAMEVLHDLSPVLSGEYRDSHTLFLNGVAVSNLKGLKIGDEVSIANFVPYARKIEVGRMKMRVPNYVYKRAAMKVRARYGNIASITATFRGLIGGGLVNPLTAGPSVLSRTIVRGAGGRFAPGTRTTRVSGGDHNKAALRYPVLIITER